MTMTLRITNLGPKQFAACVQRGTEPAAVLQIGESLDITAWREDSGRISIGEAPADESASLPPDAGEETILKFFAFAHLPPQLQVVSRPFCELAKRIVDELPRNAERSVALRKLLEGKDAAVRALLP